MRIVGEYSFNNGSAYINQRFPLLLQEVRTVISRVDASKHKTKASKEATRKLAKLYSPPGLNQAFKAEFSTFRWKNLPIACNYPTQFYVPGYQPQKKLRGTRDMDFVKEKLGVEVQFGKYSFMVYNVAAKMTIFRNLGYIDAGIEIVPVKELVREMSTGVSFFEQFIWDLEQRGVSNIDVPVLVLGITTDQPPLSAASLDTAVEVDDPEEYEEDFDNEADG